MGFEIKIAEDHTKEVKQALDAAIARGLEQCGQKARDYASMLAPVDTGRLAGSIESVVQENTAVIGTNVEYAEYQEFGTSRMGAANNGEGFLRPAVSRHIEEYKNILERTLSEI